MIRSGLPFNPMRRTPPPPPYIDTFNLIPEEYIRMISSDNHTFMLHRDCACVSPLIRKCLRDHVHSNSTAVRFDWGDEDEIEESEKQQKEIEKKEKKNSILPLIYFPTLSAAWLEVIVQYLYYKHRYEGDTETRPPFQVPVEAALEVMKVAAILQC